MTGDGRTRTKTKSSKERDKRRVQEDRAYEWYEVKVEMLDIIEQDLRLQLALRAIKEDFLACLVHFDDMQRLDDSLPECLALPALYARPSRRKSRRPPHLDPLRMTRMRLKAKFPNANIATGYDSSRERKSVSDGDNSEGKLSLGNLSAIVKSSGSSLRESLCSQSECEPGPLHSTLLSQRPPSSASSASLSSFMSVDELADSTDRDQFLLRHLPRRETPSPSGTRHARAAHTAECRTPSFNKSSYTELETSNEADESTPIVAYKCRRGVSAAPPGDGSYRPADGGRPLPAHRRMPRERFLMVSDDGSRPGSDDELSLDATCLTDDDDDDDEESGSGCLQQSRHLVGRGSPSAAGQESMEACRWSEVSTLTTPPSEGVSELSSLPLSPLTSNDSSLKESDGQYSSLLMNLPGPDDDDDDYQLRMPTETRQPSRMPGAMSRGASPALAPVIPYTPRQVPGQDDPFVPPVNSPNTTSSTPNEEQPTCASSKLTSIMTSSSTLDTRQLMMMYDDDRGSDCEVDVDDFPPSSTRPPVIGKETTPTGARDAVRSAWFTTDRAVLDSPDLVTCAALAYRKPEPCHESDPQPKKRTSKKFPIFRQIQNIGRHFKNKPRTKGVSKSDDD